MKCIGFLSAGEPDTTALYWRQFHGEIRRLTGGRHSGRIVAESLDAAELQNSAMHPSPMAGRRLAEAASRLEKRGAEGVLLCSSQLHVHADFIRRVVEMPVLHIATASAEKLRQIQLGPAAFLGLDRSVGEEKDWQRILVKHGIRNMVLPTAIDGGFVRDRLNRNLNSETASDRVRAAFTRLAVDLKHQGARVIVLTRPELAFALTEEDSALPTICALQSHCELAARFALESAKGVH